MWRPTLVVSFLFLELTTGTVTQRSLLHELRVIRGDLHSRFLKRLHRNEERCSCPKDEILPLRLVHSIFSSPRSKCHCPSLGVSEERSPHQDEQIDYSELGKAFHEGYRKGMRVVPAQKTNNATVAQKHITNNAGSNDTSSTGASPQQINQEHSPEVKPINGDGTLPTNTSRQAEHLPDQANVQSSSNIQKNAATTLAHTQGFSKLKPDLQTTTQASQEKKQ